MYARTINWLLQLLSNQSIHAWMNYTSLDNIIHAFIPWLPVHLLHALLLAFGITENNYDPAFHYTIKCCTALKTIHLNFACFIFVNLN